MEWLKLCALSSNFAAPCSVLVVGECWSLAHEPGSGVMLFPDGMEGEPSMTQDMGDKLTWRDGS
eukprot:2212554-Amphidinium_carterae.1